MPLRPPLDPPVHRPAEIADADATALEVVEDADAAVYHAKRRGRGRVEMYDADLQAAIEYEAEIELALRHGIADGELRLCSSPPSTCGRARWRAPRRWSDGSERIPAPR